MKQVVGVDVGSYSFTPGAAGVGAVTFTGLPEELVLEHVALVVNVTRGVILFNFASPAHKGSLAAGVLTLLSVDTSGHSAGDRLMCVVDVPVAEVPAAPVGGELLAGLQYVLEAMLARMPRIDAAGRCVATGAEVTQPISITTNQDIRNVTGSVASVTTMAAVGSVAKSLDLAPFHLSAGASALIYDRIAVS